MVCIGRFSTGLFTVFGLFSGRADWFFYTFLDPVSFHVLNENRLFVPKRNVLFKVLNCVCLIQSAAYPD